MKDKLQIARVVIWGYKKILRRHSPDPLRLGLLEKALADTLKQPNFPKCDDYHNGYYSLSKVWNQT